MSLIKCPECKKKISDTVISCPKCGYSISDNLSSIYADLHKKSLARKRKHYKIRCCIKNAVIILIAFVSLVIFAYPLNNGEVEKYPLFGDCITTANNILGKKVFSILNGYIENEDYTKTTNNNYVYYTFPIDNFELGRDANLIVYTAQDNSKISKVQYSFRVEGNIINDYSDWLSLRSCMPRLTGYYDADPIYTYLNSNNKHINISKNEFQNRNKKTTYYVTWQSSKGKAVYSRTNLYTEKKEYGNLIFTKN